MKYNLRLDNEEVKFDYEGFELVQFFNECLAQDLDIDDSNEVNEVLKGITKFKFDEAYDLIYEAIEELTSYNGYTITKVKEVKLEGTKAIIELVRVNH